MARNIGVILSLKDKFSPKIKDIAEKLKITENQAKKLDRALASASKNMRKSFDNMAKASFVAAGAFAAISVKSAADFEQGMNNVATLIDTDVESLDDMKKGVLELAKDSPKAIGDLTDSLYNIRSAGISADEQFNVLKGSEKLAVAGLASTAEAVDIATSAINAFGLKGEEANGVYDMFFKAVKFGKTNVAEFAQGFGAVAGVVASADINLKEYTASVAAMTTTGVKASVAHTQLKAVIAGLSRNSKEQNKVFKELGAKSFKDLIAKSGGMVNALGKLKKAVNGNEAKIIALTGSVEAYNAVMSLTGANNAKFKEALEEMANGADALDEAYAKQMAGFNNQVLKLKNSVQAIAIQFGDALVPALKLVGKGLEFLCNNMELVIPVAAGVLSTFVAFKVVTAVSAGINVLSKVLEVNTSVWKVLNMVMRQNMIMVIAIGVGLLITAIVALIRNWDKVTEAVQKAINAIKNFINLKIGKKKVEVETVNNTVEKSEKPKKHALGTTYSTGGAALVGEYGPELINLKRGDTVTPADRTRQILTNNKPVTVNVNIAGNLIGNNEFIQGFKNMLALELKTALAVV